MAEIGFSEIFVVLLCVSTIIVNHSNAECCDSGISVTYYCENEDNDRCTDPICADGTILVGSYCGVGSCNMFGCNCDGGCLQNAYGFDGDEAKRLFELKYYTVIL